MRFLLAGCTLVGVVFALLYLAANRSVFFPLRYPDGWWDRQSSVGATEVWLLTQDGVRLNAWWIPARESQRVTIFLHGNGGNLTHRIAHIQEIVAAGSSLLILDYQGYGKSEGRPSESGVYSDADTAYDWVIARGYTPKSIVIHGESLGTAVAIDLAARKECGGVVLEAPFNSGAQVAARALPILGPLVMRRFNSKAKIGRVRARILFIHGDRDEVIPYELGRDLYETAPEPKSFWTVTGAGHNDLVEVARREYRERLAAFYASLI